MIIDMATYCQYLITVVILKFVTSPHYIMNVYNTILNMLMFQIKRLPQYDF